MIYFTCPEFPGVKSVFRHAESLGLGKYVVPENLLSINFDGSDGGDMIIFGAWHSNYNLIFSKMSNVKKSVFWTSSPGQMEMSPSGIEIHIFNDIIKRLRGSGGSGIYRGGSGIYRLYLLSSELFEYVSSLYSEDVRNHKIEYFPAPFNFGVYERYKDKGKIKNSVGLFIPPNSNVRKNYYNQKIAMDMIPGIGKFGGKWLQVIDYYKMLGQMVVNLQVTHTEAFNYQVAEAIGLGTLSVVSSCIQKNLGLSHSWMVSNTDSAMEIRDNTKKLLEFYNHSESNYKQEVDIARKDLRSTTDKNNSILRSLLSKV